ncbi:hypothetical protein MAR_012030 [Mya arenaria]|uniref:Uncharacterized protein n=1 Tax=Mya arenaria TaxID=6604 RepID=A0ABY7FZT5_MYAAR|nr:hypothetical protein MAR_012030 [Mya arenaria]
MKTYLGKTFDPLQAGRQGTAVVKSLMSVCHFLHRGYHVVVGSFNCSLNLAKQLMQRYTLSRLFPKQSFINKSLDRCAYYLYARLSKCIARTCSYIRNSEKQSTNA